LAPLRLPADGRQARTAHKKKPRVSGAFFFCTKRVTVSYPTFCLAALRLIICAGRVRLQQLPVKSDIVIDMKTISLSVSEKDYEAFRAESKRTNRSIASLIREAMGEYRGQLSRGFRLTSVPVLGRTVHQARGLPRRSEIYLEGDAAGGR
jgi:hypothetical protein